MSLTVEKEFNIPPQGELRFSTLGGRFPTQAVLLAAKEGDEASSRDEIPRAEIFGAEMTVGVPLRLPPLRNYSVYSVTGCTVRLKTVSAVVQKAYVTAASQVATRSLLDFHLHLEEQRSECLSRIAAQERRVDQDEDTVSKSMPTGPRVLFVSDRHCCGCSTYVMTLAQYGCRSGYQPLVLDACHTNPFFGYPSCVSLFSIQYPIDIEEGMNFVPGVHYYVGRNTAQSSALFELSVGRALAAGASRMRAFPRCAAGGIFVDYGVISPEEIFRAESGGAGGGVSAEESPLDTLINVIVEGGIDHVCVVASAWLRHKIAQRIHDRRGKTSAETTGLIKESLAEVQLEGGGGVVRTYLLDGFGCVPPPTEGPVAAALCNQRWELYFGGSKLSRVMPAGVRLAADTVQLAVLGERDSSAMRTLMPMQDEDEEERTTRANERDGVAVKLLNLQESGLEGKIAAISSASPFRTNPEDGSLSRLSLIELETEIRNSHVVGFARIESIRDDVVKLLVCENALSGAQGCCLLLTNEAPVFGSA